MVDDVSRVLVLRLGVVESRDGIRHSVTEMLERNEKISDNLETKAKRHTTPAFPNPIPANVDARL